MQDAFDVLLRATIDHLEELKSQGTKFIRVNPENVTALTAMRTRKTTTATATAAPKASAAASARPSVTAKPQPTTPVKIVSGPAPEAAPVVITPSSGDKAGDIAALRERAMVCVKCPNLANSRKSVVWGVGDINSPIMFVGEAPGADEDEQGEPFVGRAGQLLSKIIEAMGFSRDTVYIANILKCRPDTPGQSAGNRPPTPEEIQRCLPYLNAQIDLIQPKAIVALGATAVAGLFGKSAPISKIRGQFMEFRGIPVMPTFHPSYLLRPNGFAAKPLVWQDMLLVLEKLGKPISEKQRAYFKAAA
ncbi:MAG TPA: uracil-DNA glycosylase [Verrucomicrobiae bacterium]|nr:uracil-DNA glycosylase [Verrucomicrobiae bacterium]